MSETFVLAITGASGAIYAVRLLEVLLSAGKQVHLTISPAGAQVIRHELGLPVELGAFSAAQLLPSASQIRDNPALAALWTSAREGSAGNESPRRQTPAGRPLAEQAVEQGRLVYHHYQDFRAGIASGSFLTKGMAICPCSMGTLGSLAGGVSTNLIHRAAEVHLKERRPLILVPRETPLGVIQLRNMQRVAQAGAIVLPAMPGFYHQPRGVSDLVDFIVARICDQLGVEHELMRRWGNEQ